MRSIRLMAVSTVVLAAAWACGSSGTDVGTPPVASFDQQCTGLACNFADHSTPAGGITWAWVFGDPTSATNTATIQNPSHTFTAAGTYNVQLTVTDASGASNSKTNPVTVATAANTPPVAGFTVPACVSGTACTFTSTSSDADGSITAYLWDFGDPASGANNASTDQNPIHNFNVTAATSFSVKLTVTDNGGAQNQITQAVAVQPPPATICAAQGATMVLCTLDITEQSHLTFTVVSAQCEIGGNKLEIVAPKKVVFFNGCLVADNTQYTPTDASGAPVLFLAGAPVQVRFTQGTVLDPGDPTPQSPQITLDGSWPNWTLHIDDGGAPGLPRNDDILVTIAATRVQ